MNFVAPRRPLTGRTLRTICNIQRKFDTIRDTQFVKDPKKVVPDSVLAEAQFTGNLSVYQTIFDKTHAFSLAPCQKSFSSGVHHLSWRPS